MARAVFSDHAKERLDLRYGPFMPRYFSVLVQSLTDKIRHLDYIISDYDESDSIWRIEVEVEGNVYKFVADLNGDMPRIITTLSPDRKPKKRIEYQPRKLKIKKVYKRKRINWEDEDNEYLCSTCR